MSPMDLLDRLKKYYIGDREKDPPVISATNAAWLSILFTLVYVVPFYLSTSTRPSPTLNRDAPSVIRARVYTVTIACIVATGATLYLLLQHAHAPPLDALRILGWYPIHFISIFKPSLLVLLLYMGPLFEKLFVEKDLHDFRHGQLVVETLSSWRGYRTYVAGPITEEIIFRSVLIPLHLLAKITPVRIVLLTPLYFGLAHVHHFYEFHLMYPEVALLPALARSFFQFAYTTLFGWFAAFLYLRTGSLYACIFIHAFCNWVGLPRFWGRVRPRDDYAYTPVILKGKDKKDEDYGGTSNAPRRLSLGWTVAYYVLLFLGAYAFFVGLWPLTESPDELASFSTKKK